MPIRSTIVQHGSSEIHASIGADIRLPLRLLTLSDLQSSGFIARPCRKITRDEE